MDETEGVAKTLAAHYPEAAFDAGGAVVTAGFLVSPGLPGTVRVSHRCPFPSLANGRTFDDLASEESLQTAVYGQLLRERGWMVDDRTTNRPRLLVSMPSTGVRPT